VRLGDQAYWTFNLYPDAGEGGGCFVPTLRARPVVGGASDAERSQQEAARRARSKLRRYCAANRLNRFATLTYAGAGCFDPQQLRGDVGGRGIAHIKLIGDLPVGSGALEEARVAARYLAKYVSKNIADERVPRLHRYEVAQGFQPVKVPLSGDSDLAVIGQASERMGGEPVRVWRSSAQAGWRGAPAYWCAWAQAR